jgi:peptidoglycan/LPS O-acetylase OafA/YrhL
MGSEPRSGGLDGLRGLAALSVVAFHVWLYRPDRVTGERTAALDRIFYELHLGLICFFVLSGFLLYRALLRRQDLRRYATRRIARIVPAYYASLAGCLVLYAVVGFDDIVPAADRLPFFLAFAQNYSGETLMQINPVTWTLCVEAAFYVSLPLVALVRKQATRVMVLVALVGATLAWNALVHGSGWADVGDKTLPAYAGHFALGMLAALWVESRRAPLAARRTALIAGAGVLLVVASAWWYETPGLMPDARAVVLKLPAALGFAIVIAAVAAGAGRAVRWLSARPLVWCGVVSYGVYLWHLPLIMVGNHVAALPAGIAPRLAIVTTAALAAGWASWVLVERPAIRRAGGYAASGSRLGRAPT